MNKKELIDHIEWSLDIKIEDMVDGKTGKNISHNYYLYDRVVVEDDLVDVQKVYQLKYITNEGFISTVGKNEIPTDGFLLIQRKCFLKNKYKETRKDRFLLFAI